MQRMVAGGRLDLGTFGKRCFGETKVLTAAMEEQDITTSPEDYLWRRNTVMYNSFGRSLSSCELVEGHDQDKTGSSDITHKLCFVVGSYFFE